MESKFWMTNWYHNIRLCSLITGLTGSLNFTVLRHCTKQIGNGKSPEHNQDSGSPEHNQDSGNHHTTSASGDTTLTDKLSPSRNS